MCVCVGQINISLDLGNFMRLGYSNMQSSCAAIWRLYGHRFNREIFRPTEKSKLICHLPLKSFLPVAAIETDGRNSSSNLFSLHSVQATDANCRSIHSPSPVSPFFPSGPLTTSCRQRIVPNKRAFLCFALVSSFCASYFCLYLLALHSPTFPLPLSVARAVLSSLLVVRLLISNDE